MAMVWILFGTLVLAAAFFIVSFAQVLGIEARLRRLVVETEGRLAHTYNVRLVPPGSAMPQEGAKSSRRQEPDEEADDDA